MYPHDNAAPAAPYPQGQTPPPPPAYPVFRVTVTKHIGVLVVWFNQRQTVTGSYAQCEQALKSAQTQNLLLGWWSLLSLLFNAIALSNNSAQLKSLRQQAEYAQQYAQWWFTYYGGGQGGPPAGATPQR